MDIYGYVYGCVYGYLHVVRMYSERESERGERQRVGEEREIEGGERESGEREIEERARDDYRNRAHSYESTVPCKRVCIKICFWCMYVYM